MVTSTQFKQTKEKVPEILLRDSVDLLVLVTITAT